ncbi:PREDICTED: RISC-loading complex subunit tarbp2-like [Dufourea novaeangliae]|uniref:RISC-loading complex subunit tarbp2-like n=1 Tax=Dufourea novaeangliae TaxID=178035 RepID=UPI000767493D|nr:PREDICTED: RISC-loading complex subunit tarbp2-like [Dufourea novaeangliae]
MSFINKAHELHVATGCPNTVNLWKSILPTVKLLERMDAGIVWIVLKELASFVLGDPPKAEAYINELIHDGGGTHMNTFTYRVSCYGISAIGIGRSKKDAKHEAAKAMLEAIAAHRGYLQLPASPSQSPQRTPLPPVIPETQRLPPDVPFVNAVGALKTIVIENNLQEPEYIQISDVGPPHAKIFTLQCKVANFKEFGIAKTKKQAKQEAAKKMLHKITDLVAESQDRQDPFNLEFEKNEEESTSNNMAKALYPSLSNLPLQTKVNLGYRLLDYHSKVKDSLIPMLRPALWSLLYL